MFKLWYVAISESETRTIYNLELQQLTVEIIALYDQ